MRFLKKKQVDRVLESVKKAEGKKLTLAEKIEIADRMVGQIEEAPEILDEVLRQLYEKGLEIPASERDEISAQIIKGASESEKVPDGRVVEATEAIVGQLPDDKVAKLAKDVDLGIDAKNAIVEAGISDEERKREEKVSIAIDNLHKIYESLESLISDRDIVQMISKIMNNLPKTNQSEQLKINQLVNNIIAKQMMQNYLRIATIKFQSFYAIRTPEEMFAINIPQLVKCEYKKIPTKVREKNIKEYKEEDCRRDLLGIIANHVATKYIQDGSKKIVIPQSKEMKNISEGEEQYFLEQIKQTVEALNGNIDLLTEMDIKEQIRGNAEGAKQVEDYVATMDQLPANTKKNFIQQGKEIMESEELLEISDYCNQVGLYQALASLGVDKAKQLVDTVMHSIEKRKRQIVSRENTPKVVGAKFEKKNKNSKTPLDDNDAR